MATDSRSKPSFSRGRKWSIGFTVALGLVAVFAVVVMVNYLSGQYSRRFYLSTTRRIELSPRTLNLLHSLTNQIKITLYYDKDETLYSDITGLLKEYCAQNPRIAVATVDYYRDPGAAEEVKLKYNLGTASSKNLVIFDCAGSTKVLDGKTLEEHEFSREPDSDPARPEYHKSVAFKGEMMFTAALLAVSNPKPLKAYFLQGHGEHQVADADGEMGFAKLANVLTNLNNIAVAPLSLLNNDVPADCNLLVIGGPKDKIPPAELDKIGQYLNEGGRLFVLFNALSAGRETGLESILAKWGVGVSDQIVKDPKKTTVGTDVIVEAFSKHPAVNPLTGSALQLILPREISRLNSSSQSADAPQVDEIAFSGPLAYLQNEAAATNRGALPLMVAVDKGTVKGVVNERGTTRILVVGDSIFLGNRQIESGANRDFAGYAANWLLDRTLLLEGLGPRPVAEYRLAVTRSQLQALEWILLGALPGGVLLFGGLVWLKRRH